MSIQGEETRDSGVESVDVRTPYIERVVIRDYRGIRSCEIELEPGMTLLAGRNNVGKSRILTAIQLALGGRAADVDDFTVGSATEPTIDLIIAPPPPLQEEADEEFSAEVSRLFDNGVQTISEEPLRERIGWRTSVSRSAEGLGARASTHLLNFDLSTEKWIQRSDPTVVTRNQRRLFAVDLINTGRDLVEELGRRGSNVRKILSDLEIPGAQREPLESELARLGAEIVAESVTLRSVKDRLAELHAAVGSIGEPALHPLPASLEELARMISIGLDTGNGALPMRMHGAGSRSLTSLQVQGVLYDRRLGKDGTAMPPAPVTLVEEPEAHLHPQAAMELAPLLAGLRGQKVVSTHSSHLVTSVDHTGVRLVRTGTSGISIVDLGPATKSHTAVHRAFRPDLYAEEMQKLKRLVERPFGELLFASAIIIGDGATERAFLPIVIRHALGHQAHGVCVIDPGSLSNEIAIAAVKFAHMTGTPWMLFADSDDDGKQAVRAILPHGDGDSSRVIWINGIDATGAPVDGAIEDMLLTFDQEMCQEACAAIRPDIADAPSTRKLMTKLKGSSGLYLAQHLIEKYPDHTQWPKPIQELLARLRSELQ